jgi:hypothetical protein
MMVQNTYTDTHTYMCNGTRSSNVTFKIFASILQQEKELSNDQS